MRLLEHAAGRSQEEMHASGEELAELARLCGYLPLALRPVGSLLTRLSAAELIEAMRTADHPLEYLQEADQAARTAFTVSYQALPSALHEALRACAWHPGPDFDAGSPAALTGGPRPQAAVRLAELLQRNMLIGLPQGRCTFHDLFLGYARRHTGYHPDAGEVRQARHRLYQHLTTTTDTLTQEDTDQTSNAFATPAQARTWLIAATGELITAAHTALADDWPQALALADNVAYWLRPDDKYEQATGLYTAMHTAAQNTGDRLGQAHAFHGLGDAARMQSNHEQAVEYYRRALGLYQDIGDRHGQANIHLGLALLAESQEQHKAAAQAYRSAATLYTEIGLTDWVDHCSTAYRLTKQKAWLSQ